MTQQLIGIGTAPNDGTGDNLRAAFTKANANFTELYKFNGYAKLAGDFTTSSDVAQAVGDLQFTPEVNSIYAFEARLLLRTAAAAVGPRPGINWVGIGLTDAAAQLFMPTSQVADQVLYGNLSSNFRVGVGGLPDTTNSYLATVVGHIVTGPSITGPVQVNLSSETSGTNVILKAGSVLLWSKFA